MEQLRGRVAIVTGSASGLGRAMADRFAAEGMTVVIADWRADDAAKAAAEIEANGGRAVAMQVNVADRESVVALADRVDAELGGASLLVNNAGVFPLTPLLDAEEDGWRFIVDVNLFGVIYGIQTFVPRMVASGRDCHVVNTGSIAGLQSAATTDRNRLAAGDRVPEDHAWAYGYIATKAAVIGISEMLSGELHGTRVGVSVLVPGSHRTGSLFQNSARFRPERYGGPVDPAVALAAMSKPGVVAPQSDEPPGGEARDPTELAARVVHTVRERQFYIFTHPSNRAAVQHRFDGIMAGFDDADAFRP